MREFLNHYIATTTAVIHSGTDHPEMLKPPGGVSLGTQYATNVKVSLHIMPAVTKGKVVKLESPVMGHDKI